MILKNKIAVITGGSRGIGKATAILFAKEGATVIILDVLTEGNKTTEDIRKEGGRAFYMEMDVSEPEQIDKTFESIITDHDRIDILINNAGITRDHTLHKMTADEWQRVIDINLSGVFHCTKSVVPYMKERGFGRIISASSIVGLRGGFGQTNYAAAKAGIIAMTKTWAFELGKYGITANCIAPGFISSDMTDAIPDEARERMISEIPVKRTGTPEDIANGYLFLASDNASFINGICLSIDGGVPR